MKTRVVIVGAGPGGLAAAMLLATRGFQVTVYERQSHLGGRSGSLQLGAYRFDVGSTMLMMPFVVEELFELAGRRLEEEVSLLKVEPMYRLDFGSRALDMYADPARMAEELQRFSPGSELGLARFLNRERERLDHLYPVLQRSWPGLGSLLSKDVISALPHVGLGQSLYQTASHYFDDETLRLAFSFQSAYLGMSPWECPGGFGMVPYVEHEWGLFYIRGGIHQLNEAMARVAEQAGARIVRGLGVQKLRVEEDRCRGVVLDDGTEVEVDHVVINADATRAVLKLLDDDVSIRFSRSHLSRMHESCSTFMLYLGLDRILPLGHHTFYFAEDYEAEMRRVFHEGTLGEDASLYVCNPAYSDPSVAPPGHSSLYLLALVPNTQASIDWSQKTPWLRTNLLRTLERRLGLPLEPHIQVEGIIHPMDWSQGYGVSHGAVFGPAHSIDQLLAFRLPNRLPHPSNVFLAGGGTSPGSGLPTILESARIATRMICEDASVPFPASRALPVIAPWHPNQTELSP